MRISQNTCRNRTISIHAPARGATESLRFFRCRPGISIHAPARGATAGSWLSTGRYTISIHAPARGATSVHWLFSNIGKFQSTLPRGERQKIQSHHSFLGSISIHAPARGATEGGDTVASAILVFQSTLPRGERLSVGKDGRKCLSFQSTLPRGERHKKVAVTFDRFTISIHAPARGATKATTRSRTHLQISIHAPARGATKVTSFFFGEE